MYYRLTYLASSTQERRGDSVLNGYRPLNIGQGAACEVQLPESELYEPQLYASILPMGEDAEGRPAKAGQWCVVRRTDCHRMAVNGEDVPVARALSDGDVLSMTDGQMWAKLKFEVFDDGEYDASLGFVYRKHTHHRRDMLLTMGLAVLAICIAVYALFVLPQRDLRHSDSDLRQFIPSIYHITCDSVYLLRDDVVVDSVELQQATEGTAFLTTDSLLVTARHCVEPWINDDEWDGVSSQAKMSPEVRLATMAETQNRLAGEERYTLRAHCVVSRGLERFDYYSTDFHLNKSRDMVVRLGTEQEPIYWRTIIPMASRRTMELGDFAYVKAPHLTTGDNRVLLPLATEEDVKTLAQSENRDIAVMGYPLNDAGKDGATVVYGNWMEFDDELEKEEGCLQLSVAINRGNSGGPVLAQIGRAIKVIGIVSKADAHADQGVFWAVPVGEVVNMHGNGDQPINTEADRNTFRR
ncbi:MAG: serine protease [Bacteroidaceae bacterium]|nr:serine protease [Bacteroidaceae bacterium]